VQKLRISTVFLKPACSKAYVLQKSGAKRTHGVTDYSEERRRFRRPGPPLTARHPKLFPELPHDRGCRFQANADSASLVDEGTLGGNPPDDILGGQYRRHSAITLRRGQVWS
jgi:hypothetical protein